MSKWPIEPLLNAAGLVTTRVGTFVGSRSYVSTGDVDRTAIVSSEPVTFDDRPSRADLAAKNGDVLFARMQATNKVIVVTQETEDHLWSTGFASLRPKANTNSQWLRYWLGSSFFNDRKDSLCTGATQKSITNDGIRKLEIPLPPLPEQERIVRMLDEAEALRRLRIDADEQTSRITAALFDEMFGNPSSNSKGWDTATLGGLGTAVTGNTPPRSDSSFYGNFIEWVKTDNIDATRGMVRPSAERLSDTGAMRGRVVPEGSVLITCIAGSIELIGDAAITDRKVAINQQINAIVPNENVESAFLGSLVRALKPLIQASATGVMTRIINKSELEKIPAIIPPSPLQRQFAARITEIRELESAQAASRQRLDNLFQSLLHRAFQGEL